jgi:hypothetical protein
MTLKIPKEAGSMVFQLMEGFQTIIRPLKDCRVEIIIGKLSSLIEYTAGVYQEHAPKFFLFVM